MQLVNGLNDVDCKDFVSFTEYFAGESMMIRIEIYVQVMPFVLAVTWKKEQTMQDNIFSFEASFSKIIGLNFTFYVKYNNFA